jgi:molecular chaperone GrpE
VTEQQHDGAEALEEIEAELPVEEEAEPASEEGEPLDGREAEDEDTGLAGLLQELEEARAKEAEYLDGWQRARAELANARKRFQREREQAYANSKADMWARLLPVVDDFERAVEALPDDLSGETWIEGVMLVRRNLEKLLDQDGVTPIDAVGHEFDPLVHQAITHEPCETVPEGHVISELQKGYKMGDRVLRPTMARVSSGPPPEAEPQADEQEEPTDDEQTEN